MIRLQWRMEYRKHRLNWLACGLLVIFILLAGVIGAIMEGWSVGDAVQVCSLFASPLVFLLLGAGAGAGLRREDWKTWDELLPITPRQRVLSAYGCSLAVSGMVFGLLSIFYLKSAPFLPNVSALRDPLGDLNQIPTLFLALVCVYLHGAAFAATYWSNSTFLGGGFSLLLSGGTLWVIWWQLTDLSGLLRWGHNDNYRLDLLFPLILTLMPLGVFVVIWFLPGKIEQKKKRSPFFSLTMLIFLCLGLLGSLLLPLRVKWVEENYVKPPPIHMDHGGYLFRAGRSGIFGMTASGTLLHIAPDGTRTMVYEALPLPWNMERYYGPYDFTLDDQGTLWLMTDEFPNQGESSWRLYRGKPGQELTPYSKTFPWRPSFTRLKRRGDETVLYRKTPDNSVYFAPLPKGEEDLQWQEVLIPVADHMLEPFVETGMVAVLDESGQTLNQNHPSGQARTWVLPHPAKSLTAREFHSYTEFRTVNSDHLVVPAAKTPDGLVFAVIMALPNQLFQLALCFPDGRVTSPWPATPQPQWMLMVGMDGTLLKGGGELRFLSAEGQAFPLLTNEAEINKQVTTELFNGDDRVGPLFRLEGEKAWLGAKETIIVMDLGNGEVIQQTPARHSMDDRIRHWGGWQRNLNGFYLSRNGELFRVNWDGSETHLGSISIGGKP